MGYNIEVMVAHELDVQNCFKDVPNFMKYVPNFMKYVPKFINDAPNCLQDVPQVPISILRWGITSNSSQGSPKEYMNYENENRGLGSSKNGYTQDPKVLFGVGKDLQLLINGPKGIYTS